MRYLLLLAVVAASVATGCQAAPAAPPVQIALGKPFTLALGEDASIDGEALTLRFDRVLTDSRCPKLVTCVWTGEARLTVLVEQNGKDQATVEFNTNPAPGLNKQQADIGPYAIRLIALDPYPQTPADIPLDAYRAVLRVDKT